MSVQAGTAVMMYQSTTRRSNRRLAGGWSSRTTLSLPSICIPLLVVSHMERFGAAGPRFLLPVSVLYFFAVSYIEQFGAVEPRFVLLLPVYLSWYHTLIGLSHSFLVPVSCDLCCLRAGLCLLFFFLLLGSRIPCPLSDFLV